MGLSLSTLVDMGTGDMRELLQVGRRVLELTDMAEADNSVPQITGWVMSRARANLWRIMLRAGLHNLDYVDTDSVIVNAHGHAALKSEGWDDPAIHLLHKATYKGAKIYGPRNIVLEDTRRLSGIPKRAILTGELHFDGEVWAGLRTSLEAHQPHSVAVIPRAFDVEDVDPRRQRVEGGTTTPYERGSDDEL